MGNQEPQETSGPVVGTEGLKAAAQTTKQIITLATGIIALTVTFAKEFKVPDTALTVPSTLIFAWGAYGLTVLFGIWTLMAITGTLDRVDRRCKTDGAMQGSIRVPSMMMVICFLIALVLTIVAGAEVVS